MRKLSVVFLFPLLALSLYAETLQLKTEANVPIEITLSANQGHRDPFNDVQVDVLFTQPDGQTKLVPAFWDGGNLWKVRYASPVTGTHQWKAQCSDVTDKVLSEATGSVNISKYHGKNPLFLHGPIHIAEDKRHFVHADGTPFFWLGDTWWMGLCHRLHFPDEFQQLAVDRKEKGFNVIQIVAGLYPDMHPFDPRGANEAGFPWETNYARIRPEYFDAADKRIKYLVDQGFTPCIVGAWGYFLPWMGVDKAKQHWRELIARYGSWPVVWCIAGEANLPWYLAKGFPYDDRELVHGWTEVARYVRATDSFRHPVTIHPTGIGKLNSRWAIDDASLIDFDMLQTPHGERDAVAPTISAFQHAYNLPPAMPVLNGEASYEMLNGQIQAQWTRAMFWLCMIQGAAGHTYGANGIWQVNRRDQPHGASPHGGNYGTIPWDDAMRLPGSGQIGAARKFLEKFAWNKCVPLPNSVTWGESNVANWGKWIWFPEGDATVDAPLQPRFFRRTVNIPNSAKLQRAIVRFSADDTAALWVNGTRVGDAADWRSPRTFDITKLLRSGNNVVAIRAENLPAPVTKNPAGLNAAVDLSSENGNETISSDEKWRVSREEVIGWATSGFDDSQWVTAKVLAEYGKGPWGKIDSDDPTFVPFALGMGDTLRIVYVLSPRAVTVSNLRPKTKYRLTMFDPVTGESRRDHATTDEHGVWHSPAPSHGHDYAFALER